jgi:hypothetical protein
VTGGRAGSGGYEGFVSEAEPPNVLGPASRSATTLLRVVDGMGRPFPNPRERYRTQKVAGPRYAFHRFVRTMVGDLCRDVGSNAKSRAPMGKWTEDGAQVGRDVRV